MKRENEWVQSEVTEEKPRPSEKRQINLGDGKIMATA